MRSPAEVSQKRKFSRCPPKTMGHCGLSGRNRTLETRHPPPKARHWQAFLRMPAAFFLRARLPSIRRQESNLDMAISKADALACPRGFAEPHFIEFISRWKHSNFENRTESAESRALERIGPFGEEWTSSAVWKSGTQIRIVANAGLNCQHLRAENTRLREAGGGRGTGIEPSPVEESWRCLRIAPREFHYT
jgi:hypothetical protein